MQETQDSIYKSDPIDRAIRAYFRHPIGTPMQPSAALSEVREIDGRSYVVLANGYQTLAVYRVRGDGGLRRLADDEIQVLRGAA